MYFGALNSVFLPTLTNFLYKSHDDAENGSFLTLGYAHGNCVQPDTVNCWNQHSLPWLAMWGKGISCKQFQSFFFFFLSSFPGHLCVNCSWDFAYLVGSLWFEFWNVIQLVPAPNSGHFHGQQNCWNLIYSNLWSIHSLMNIIWLMGGKNKCSWEETFSKVAKSKWIDYAAE